jgi:hypothetical protein
MSKVFITLAQRYKDRSGGYTRIMRYGRRRGDKAEMAVVCLVGGPRDLKFEMMARVVGKQAVVGQNNTKAVKGGKLRPLGGVLEDWRPFLTEATKKELESLLRLRSAAEIKEFEKKAMRYAVRCCDVKLRYALGLLTKQDEVCVQHRTLALKPRANAKKDAKVESATEQRSAGVLVPRIWSISDFQADERREEKPKLRYKPNYKPKAGERLPGMSIHQTGLGIAKNILRSGLVMGRGKRKPLEPLVHKFLKKAGTVQMASLNAN